MAGKITLFMMLLLFLAQEIYADDPIVRTTMGSLIGRQIQVGETTIQVFKGVPYALPPVGVRRWKPAEPVTVAWEGERQAKAFSPACMQPQSVKDRNHLSYNPMPQMSEDCLYLNIWAPTGSGKKSNAKYPVMVWIHGGSLVDGAASMPLYNGAELARKGVVVVSINYRLNVFGYFSHPELTAESPHQASGNYGVIDQIQALKWVRDNIAAFGGDPNNVTIFGESAGAYSVVQLLVSPLSRGLFHRAIAQSPYLKALPALKQGQFGFPAAEQAGLGFAKSLGKQSIAELRALPATELLNTVNKIEDAYAMIPNPVVDDWVFPAQLFELFEQGRQHDVPILFGYNSNEGYNLHFIFGPAWADKQPKSRDEYVSKVRARYGALTDDYLALYPFNNYREMAFGPYRDGFFGWATQKVVREHRRVSADAYLYYFDHALQWAKEKGIDAAHGFELPFTFNNIEHNVKYSPSWPDLDPTSDDVRLADTMSDYWVAFARQGVPAVNELPEWAAYSEKSRDYMVFRKGRAQPGKNLLPGAFELHEKIIQARRARKEIPWNLVNIGLLAPVQQ